MKSVHGFSTIAPEVKVSYNRPKKMIKISAPGDSHEVFKKIWDPTLIDLQEQAYALFLNRSNNLLGWRLLGTGNGTKVIFDKKLLAAIALKVNANSVIIAHNHPSGSLKPSHSDIELTRSLASTLKLIDIELSDHLIVSKDNYESILVKSLMQEIKEKEVSEEVSTTEKNEGISLLSDLEKAQDELLNWYKTKEEAYDQLDLIWKQWLSFSIENTLDNDFIWSGMNMFQHFHKYLRSIKTDEKL